jgi:methylated-DNA-[protein]-cysteine S-methyltransferase
MAMTYETATIATPLGPARALARAGRLCALELEGGPPHAAHPEARVVRDPAGVATALAAYFRGELEALAAVPVDPEGTPFQRRVWAALRTIPPGTTRTYGEIAHLIGAPTAARAVGAASRANPIWLLVPCHRVIGASGKLTGYAAGLDTKRWLLAHEAAHARAAGAADVGTLAG